MNVYQRIILVSGAIILVTAIWTTPKLYYVRASYYLPEAYGLGNTGAALVMDVREASMRAVTVLGVTILLFYAAKGIGPRKDFASTIHDIDAKED